ncbi:hypothetical protein X943_004029 [Babesia divergens]|uniref:Uncharacterized protein n=1 Tax=Babesia divergens TaxID=32595 RepID=A0AAD9G836_BABDI|nr:hypothetical protein X943_004029 [Babesia divergens]
MDYQMNNSYKCCMVTPGQTSSAGFSDRENRCVTVVPPQEEGYMMADGYRFSDGYSMDYEQLKNYAPMQTTFQCDPTLYDGSGHYIRGEMPEMYHQQHFYNATYPEHYGNFQGCQEVMGTEVLPQVSNQGMPFTTEFFASNDAFKRIPLYPSRAVFRRRKQGDATNEWSNAFLNDETDLCEVTPCCTG